MEIVNYYDIETIKKIEKMKIEKIVTQKTFAFNKREYFRKVLSFLLIILFGLYFCFIYDRWGGVFGLLPILVFIFFMVLELKKIYDFIHNRAQIARNLVKENMTCVYKFGEENLVVEEYDLDKQLKAKMTIAIKAIDKIIYCKQGVVLNSHNKVIAVIIADDKTKEDLKSRLKL